MEHSYAHHAGNSSLPPLPLTPIIPKNFTNFCERLYFTNDILGRIPAIDLINSIGSLLFLVFLLVYSPKAFMRLRGRKYCMRAVYYIFVWLVAMLTIIRCVLTYAFDLKSKVARPFWVASSNVALLLEISVLVYLFQGKSKNYWTIVARTLSIGFGVVLVNMAAQMVIIYKFGIAIFNYPRESVFYWVPFCALFVIVYAVILSLPFLKLYDMPVRPAFYRYIMFLLIINGMQMLGTVLVFCLTAWGFCFIDMHLFSYYSLFAPLMYFTFLWDFFHGKKTQSLVEAINYQGEKAPLCTSDMYYGSNVESDFDWEKEPTGTLSPEPTRGRARLIESY